MYVFLIIIWHLEWFVYICFLICIRITPLPQPKLSLGWGAVWQQEKLGACVLSPCQLGERGAQKTDAGRERSERINPIWNPTYDVAGWGKGKWPWKVTLRSDPGSFHEKHPEGEYLREVGAAQTEAWKGDPRMRRKRVGLRNGPTDTEELGERGWRLQVGDKT